MAWNFHGFVALPLERYANKYIHCSYTTADEIACGGFFETMYSVLDFKGVDKSAKANFIDMCRDFENVVQPIYQEKTHKKFSMNSNG